MSQIQFGFVMPGGFTGRAAQNSHVDALDRTLERISGAFTSAWMVDHLQFGDTAILEGFTSAAYMAGRHPQLQFGNMVLCQSFRNPALLAKMAATLQFLSGGRFILGLGAGWHEAEYRAYGYDFPPNAVRVAQLEETLRIVRAMWSGEPATFEGQYYQVREARCEPSPNPPPPIILGAFKPRMLRLAARYADGWNVSSSGLPRYRRMANEFERACAEVGRAPASVRRSWGGGVACAATQAQAELLAGERFSAQAAEGDFGFVGTPAQVIAQMRAFIELGVTEFILDCEGFPDLACLQHVLDEVVPAFQE